MEDRNCTTPEKFAHFERGKIFYYKDIGYKLYTIILLHGIAIDKEYMAKNLGIEYFLVYRDEEGQIGCLLLGEKELLDIEFYKEMKITLVDASEEDEVPKIEFVGEIEHDTSYIESFLRNFNQKCATNNCAQKFAKFKRSKGFYYKDKLHIIVSLSKIGTDREYIAKKFGIEYFLICQNEKKQLDVLLLGEKELLDIELFDLSEEELLKFELFTEEMERAPNYIKSFINHFNQKFAKFKCGKKFCYQDKIYIMGTLDYLLLTEDGIIKNVGAKLDENGEIRSLGIQIPEDKRDCLYIMFCLDEQEQRYCIPLKEYELLDIKFLD